MSNALVAAIDAEKASTVCKNRNIERYVREYRTRLQRLESLKTLASEENVKMLEKAGICLSDTLKRRVSLLPLIVDVMKGKADKQINAIRQCAIDERFSKLDATKALEAFYERSTALYKASLLCEALCLLRIVKQGKNDEYAFNA